MALTLLLLFIALVLVFLALHQFWLDALEKSRLRGAVLADEVSDSALSRWSRIDRHMLNGRWGRGIQNSLTLSGLSLTPSRFILVCMALCLVTGFVLGSLLSWLLFPVGVYSGYAVIKAYIERQRTKRREDFIIQMPELARTLSNASSAGLSIRTAVAIAADELSEPAQSELRTVTEELSLGVSLDTALSAMEDRLPSRELAILVSSLVVSARTGGALVSALREIADTLESRKEVRREIRTTYAQTIATAYAVLGMGALSLVMLESINKGTVDAMLRNPIGQAALIFAVVVYSGGIWAVRRMTRIEL